MKIFEIAPYLYREDTPEFERNKTGFGMMVHSIITAMGEKEEIVFSSMVITGGHSINDGRVRVLSHTWKDVLLSSRLNNYISCLHSFFSSSGSLKNRLRNGFISLDSGYLYKMIEQETPDVVHIHGVSSYTKQAIKIARNMKIPCVLTLHGLFGIDNKGTIYQDERQIEKRVINEAVLNRIPISVISSGIKERIEKYYIQTETRNISVITNGIFIKENCCKIGQFSNPQYAVLYEQLQNCREIGCKIIFYVGNISDNKNQIQLVRAMKMLIDDEVNVLAVLFGNEVDGGKTRDEINKLGLSDRIILAGFCNEVDKLWELADVNVLLSFSEGFGLSIIEAYSNGKPSIIHRDIDAFKDVYYPDAIITPTNREDYAVANAIKDAFRTDWDEDRIRAYAKKFDLKSIADMYISWCGDAARGGRHE